MDLDHEHQGEVANSRLKGEDATAWLDHRERETPKGSVVRQKANFVEEKPYFA